MRIGVSQDVDGCYKNAEGYGESESANLEINGILFTRFSLNEATATSYLEGESYRTIKNNQCYVIERMRTGSRYKDENMATGTPDLLLNKYYDASYSIIKTFTFIQ